LANFFNNNNNFVGPNGRYDWDLVTTVALFTDSVNPEFLCHAHAKKVRVVWGAAFPVSNLTNAEQRYRTRTRTHTTAHAHVARARARARPHTRARG
jgi:hypothetical protein